MLQVKVSKDARPESLYRRGKGLGKWLCLQEQAGGGCTSRNKVSTGIGSAIRSLVNRQSHCKCLCSQVASPELSDPGLVLGTLVSRVSFQGPLPLIQGGCACVAVRGAEPALLFQPRVAVISAILDIEKSLRPQESKEVTKDRECKEAEDFPGKS